MEKIIVYTTFKLRDKIEINEKKGKLKKKRIYIDHDMTEKEKKVQNIIKNRAIEERKERKKDKNKIQEKIGEKSYMERGSKEISRKKFLEDNQRRVEKEGKTEEERKRRREERKNRWKDKERKNKNDFLEYCRFGEKRRIIILRILT